MNKPNYKRQDVCQINLGQIGSKEIIGHEQGSSRPCIVLKVLHQFGLAIIIPCTSKKPKRIGFTHVKLDKGKGGLIYDSYALCHQLRTVSFDRFERKIGQLPSEEFNKVRTVISDLIQ